MATLSTLEPEVFAVNVGGPELDFILDELRRHKYIARVGKDHIHRIIVQQWTDLGEDVPNGDKPWISRIHSLWMTAYDELWIQSMDRHLPRGSDTVWPVCLIMANDDPEDVAVSRNFPGPGTRTPLQVSRRMFWGIRKLFYRHVDGIPATDRQ